MLANVKALIGKAVLNFSPEAYTNYIFRRISKITWSSVYTKNDNPETLYIKYFINPESVFFDVGANKGLFVWLMSKSLDRNNIYVFEPIPELYKNLCKIFSKAHIYNVALSNEDGTQEFKIPVIQGKVYDTRGTLNTNFIEQGETDFSLIKVKTQRLDTIIKTIAIDKLDFIKIDVEGFEENVLLGAEETIKKFNPTLFVEIEQRHHTQSITDMILRFTEKHAYSCFYFDTIRKAFVSFDSNTSIETIQNLDNFKVNQAEYINNFFFIPNKKAADGYISDINKKIPQN